MRDLDAQAVRDLLALYQAAGDEVRAAIRARVGADDAVAREHLQGLLRQIEDIALALGQRRDAAISTAIDRAAELGVRPYTPAGAAAVGSGAAVLDSAAAMRVHQEEVAFVQAFRAADGLTLSDRLWRLDQGAKEVLQRAIGNAVVQGWSGTRAAMDLAMRGQAVTADVARQVAGAKAGALVRVADLLTSGDGAELWKAERVMRTEINRAHGEAYMAAGEQTPGFGGWRYLLSPRHPGPDICFRAGTLVTTQRGEIPIEQVREGDMALTHRGRWRAVVRLYRSASGPSGLVRLCFPAGTNRSQEVVMTPNHPVLTPQGWTAAGDLRTGSAVVCLASAAQTLPQPAGAGERRTASAGSGETASACAAKTADPARCDAREPQHRHTPRSGWEVFLRPIASPTFGAAMRRLFGFLPSMPGWLAPCAVPTATAGTGPSAETGPDGACRSSGWPRPPWGRTLCSNTAVHRGTTSTGTPCHSPRTEAGARRDPGHSTPWSRTPGFAFAAGTAQPETVSGTRGTPWEAGWTWPEPRRRDHKTAWWWIACLAPIGPGWVQAACRNVRRAFGVGSSRHHIAFTPEHPAVDLLPATGEEVFNLEVDEDHSYVAGGVVVHNCDLLASQNLHGLGPGVYPDRARCPWPAHPNTLSFVELVFADEVTDADRAGKETELQALGRLAPEIRAGVLGQTKAAYFDAGLLRSKGMIRSPLRAVNARLERQGVLG